MTPVSQHGQLSVKGANIVDKNGKVFKIKGMSTHGIMWEDFSDILTKNSLKVLRDDWKVNTIRIAMYTEEWGGYCTENGKYQAQAKQKVKTGVENAKSLGMYAIIDWHVLNDKTLTTTKMKLSSSSQKWLRPTRITITLFTRSATSLTAV